MPEIKKSLLLFEYWLLLLYPNCLTFVVKLPNPFFLWTYSNLILFRSVWCRLKIQAKWTTARRKLLKLWFCFDPCSTIHFMGPHIVFVHIFCTEGLLHFWIYAGAWILQSYSNSQARRKGKSNSPIGSDLTTWRCHTSSWATSKERLGKSLAIKLKMTFRGLLIDANSKVEVFI